MDTNRSPLLQPILDLGQGTLLVLKAVAGAPRLLTHRDSRRAFADQLYLCGISTLPVLTVTAIFMGMILALETGIELQRWSQEEYIASAVMVSMLREMGPFLSALVMAACVGSSISAQLGTMAVNEELSALELMSIDPIRYLATPRIWAMALMMPLLSFCACMFGLLGGAAVGTTQLNVDWRLYFQVALHWAELKDLWVGLFKAFCFGIVISGVACHFGLATTGGATGVGKATRHCVIVSFLLILVTGYIITRCFYGFAR